MDNDSSIDRCWYGTDSAVQQQTRHDSVVPQDSFTATLSQAVGFKDLSTSPQRHSQELGNPTNVLLTVASHKPQGHALPDESIERGHLPLAITPATSVSKQSSSPTPKTAGSIWLSKYDGKLWPVVLCDENTAPRRFVESRRNTAHLPAILLGKRIYIWTLNEKLQEFDGNKDYLEGCKRFETDDILPTDSAIDRVEKERVKAFVQDARMSGDHSFWMNAIKQKRAEVKVRSDIGRKHARSETALGTARLINGHGSRPYKRRRIITHHDGNLELPIVKKIPPKRQTIKDAYELDDEVFAFQEEEHEDGRRPAEKDDVELLPAAEDQESIQIRTRDAVNRLTGTCTILVGMEKDKEIFQMPNSALAPCVELSRLMGFCDQRREDSVIRLYDHLTMQAEDFKTVAAYLIKGNFSPALISGDDGRPTLEGVTNGAKSDAVAARLAALYRTASRLRFGELQEACVRKLNVLESLSPSTLVPIIAYINGAEAHGCYAEVLMAQWLIEQVATSFWALVEGQGAMFAAMMRENIKVRTAVLERLAGSRCETGEDREKEEES